MAASGVLLSGGLVHMLADAAKVLNEGFDFPMANFVAGMTFIGFMVLEESLHLLFMMNDDDEEEGVLKEFMLLSHGHDHSNHGSCMNSPKTTNNGHHNHGQDGHAEEEHNHQNEQHNHHQEEDDKHQHNHKHSQEDEHQHNHSHQEEDQEEHGHNHSNHSKDEHDHNHSHQAEEDHHEHGHEHANNETQPLLNNHDGHSHDYDTLPLRSVSQNHANNHNHSHNMSIRRTGCSGCVGSYAPHTYAHTQPLVLDSTDHAVEPRQSVLSLEFGPQHHHHHDDHLELHLHGSCFASGILLLALSIHSILAGVSIGIERSSETIASTAIAIVAHKSFEGFCLGSSFVSAQIQGTTFWGLSLCWGVMTPLGILIGQVIFLLTKSMSADDVEGNHTIAIVQAMCSGTFLYIAIVEIGGKELLACRHNETQHGSKFQKQIDAAKLVCFILGYLAMSSLAIFV
eukprot:Sro1724_g293670.2  (454) ;mRNA; r:6164-7525